MIVGPTQNVTTTTIDSFALNTESVSNFENECGSRIDIHYWSYYDSL